MKNSKILTKRVIALILSFMMIFGTLIATLVVMLPMGVVAVDNDLALTKTVAMVDDECMEYDITLNVSGKLPTNVIPRPIDIVLVLDISSSMSTNSNAGLDALKLATKGFIDLVANFNRDCRIGIVTFGTNASEYKPLTTLSVPNATNLKSAVDSLTIPNNSYTDTPAGLATGRKVLADAKAAGGAGYNREQMMVLMTDGVPYPNPTSKYCGGTSSSNPSSHYANSGDITVISGYTLSGKTIQEKRIALNNTADFQALQGSTAGTLTDPGNGRTGSGTTRDPYVYTVCSHSSSSASYCTCEMAATVLAAEAVRNDNVTLFSVGLYGGVTGAKTLNIAEYFLKKTVVNPAYYYRQAVTANLDQMFADIANIITSALVVTDGITATNGSTGFTLNDRMFDFVGFVESDGTIKSSATDNGAGAKYIVTLDNSGNITGHQLYWTVDVSGLNAGAQLDKSVTFRVKAKNQYAMSSYNYSGGGAIPQSTTSYNAFTNAGDTKAHLSYNKIPTPNADLIPVNIYSDAITSIAGYSTEMNAALQGKVKLPGFTVTASGSGNVVSGAMPTISATANFDDICLGEDGSHEECNHIENISWQWYEVNGTTATTISGATSASYTVPAGKLTIAGATYKYLVEAIACCGHKASAIVELTVNPNFNLTINKNWFTTINNGSETRYTPENPLTATFKITGPNEYEETVYVNSDDGSFTISLAKLDAGVYTITEMDSGATGFVEVSSNGVKEVPANSNTDQSVTFKNLKNTNTGSISVSKTWDHQINGATQPADGYTATFEIKDATGAPYSCTGATNGTFNITGNNSTVLSGLEPGTYTIKETATTLDGAVPSISADGVEVTLADTPNATGSVTVTNTKKVVEFEVTKTWQHIIDGVDQIIDDNYTATFQLFKDNVAYPVPNKTDENGCFTIVGDGSKEFKDLPADGEYTAKEISHSAPRLAYGELNTQKNGYDFTNILIENNTTRLIIRKNWTYKLNGQSASHDFSGYTATFGIYAFNDETMDYDQIDEVTVNGIGASLSNVDLNVNETYLVKELRADGEKAHLVTTAAADQPITIILPQRATDNMVTFNNPIEENLSTLTISKSWNHTINNIPQDPDSYVASFEITGPNDYTNTITITGSDSETIENLIPGTYTVTELGLSDYDTTSTYVIGEESFNGGKSVTVELIGDQGVGISRRVSFANTKTELYGLVEVDKSWEYKLNGEVQTLESNLSATFELYYNADCTGEPLETKTYAGFKVSFDTHLIVGHEYGIKESSCTDGYSPEENINIKSFTATAAIGTVNSVSFKNVKEEYTYTPEIDILKTVTTGSGSTVSAPSGTTFTFELFEQDKETLVETRVGEYSIVTTASGSSSDLYSAMIVNGEANGIIKLGEYTNKDATLILKEVIPENPGNWTYDTRVWQITIDNGVIGIDGIGYWANNNREGNLTIVHGDSDVPTASFANSYYYYYYNESSSTTATTTITTTTTTENITTTVTTTTENITTTTEPTVEVTTEELIEETDATVPLTEVIFPDEPEVTTAAPTTTEETIEEELVEPEEPTVPLAVFVATEEEPEEERANPQTGNNIVPILLMVTLMGAGAVTFMYTRKRLNKTK